jgi:hypothetical protein
LETERHKEIRHFESVIFLFSIELYPVSLLSGADPGFQVRGGGALKKIAPSGGGARKLLGYFV